MSRHGDFVWQTLRRFGVPESLADDASQLVFLAFSARVSEVQAQSERSFLTGTCLRIAANVRRGLARRRETSGVCMELQAADDPERLLQLKRRRLALSAALTGLPADQKTVFMLFAIDGLSLPNIARQLDIPLGTATSRLRRARLKMEAVLQTGTH